MRLLCGLALQQVKCNTLGRLIKISASNFSSDTFYHKDLEVIKCNSRKPLPPKDELLGFGKIYTDHMLEIDWTKDGGWNAPVIKPLKNLSLHPACKALHYAIEIFEGIKAFRGVDDKIRIFRIDQNMQRMWTSAERSGLPTFDCNELQKLIVELVRLDKDSVPDMYRNKLFPSVYIRPTMIATDPILGITKPQMAKLFVIMSPVDHYYGNREISLLADPKYVRAFPGGCGAYKVAGNYAPTIMIGAQAEELGCKQALWLYGEDELLTEAGTMNIFVYWINDKNERELVTPPLVDGLVLPGVTRDSILQLAHEWKSEFSNMKISERYVTMDELRRACLENRMLEMFGAGTAVVITPIGRILYRKPQDGAFEQLLIPTAGNQVWGKNLTRKLHSSLRAIQRGKVERPEWITLVD